MKRVHAPYDFAAVLGLLQRAFSFMEGRIDPPSSLDRMTVDGLIQEAHTKELWVIEDKGRPIACMLLTPKPDTMYLGKLAVDHAFRGRGLSRQMIEQAECRAKALGLPSVTLQARIELTSNHATFLALGFRQTAETAHEGYDRPTSLTFEKRLN